jgi:hypothetical protein
MCYGVKWLRLRTHQVFFSGVSRALQNCFTHTDDAGQWFAELKLLWIDHLGRGKLLRFDGLCTL